LVIRRSEADFQFSPTYYIECGAGVRGDAIPFLDVQHASWLDTKCYQSLLWDSSLGLSLANQNNSTDRFFLVKKRRMGKTFCVLMIKKIRWWVLRNIVLSDFRWKDCVHE